MYRGGETYWYHKDALGSIYQMTDEDETVVRSYDYSAFGTIIAETGAIENPFTYTAREYDAESGLYYYRARYYDADVGRFLGRDPILALISSTETSFFSVNLRSAVLNLYLYARSNPVSFTDPAGYFVKPDTLHVCPMYSDPDLMDCIDPGKLIACALINILILATFGTGCFLAIVADVEPVTKAAGIIGGCGVVALTLVGCIAVAWKC